MTKWYTIIIIIIIVISSSHDSSPHAHTAIQTDEQSSSSTNLLTFTAADGWGPSRTAATINRPHFFFFAATTGMP